jgi:hypothetical protein
MYSVSTLTLTDNLDAPFLSGVSEAFTLIALAAWLWTFVGFLGSRWGGAAGAPPQR